MNTRACRPRSQRRACGAKRARPVGGTALSAGPQGTGLKNLSDLVAGTLRGVYGAAGAGPDPDRRPRRRQNQLCTRRAPPETSSPTPATVLQPARVNKTVSKTSFFIYHSSYHHTSG